MASKLERLEDLNNVWMRILIPLWFAGCYQFTWQVLYASAPRFAYFSLLNPMVYCMEGMRGSIFNPADSLPFGLCVGALIFWTVLFGYLGIKRLKKRLDCV